MTAIAQMLLSPRFTSFYWRTIMMAVAAGIAYAAAHIVDLQLSGSETAIFGLILGETSKGITDSLKTS